jgi:hypothetical protein
VAGAVRILLCSERRCEEDAERLAIHEGIGWISRNKAIIIHLRGTLM